MKLIRIEKLIRAQPAAGAAPDWRRVELFELPPDGARPVRYVVHVSRSRDALKWQESVHTPAPLALQQAQAAFEGALAGQVAQGYRRTDAATSTVAGAAAPATPATAQSADAVLLASLQPDRWRLLPPARQSRLVWRIGERRLAAAAARLVELIESGAPLLDYCLAWALGRCGDAGAWPAMRTLAGRAREPRVVRIARWAALALWPQNDRAAEAARIADDWPAALRRVWAEAGALPVTDGAALLSAQLFDARTGDPASECWQKLSQDNWITQLFELSLLEGPADEVDDDTPGLARAALRLIAPQLPLSAGWFRAWRRLYKGAEFIADYRLLGLLHQRVETGRAAWRSGTRFTQIGGRRIEVAKEIRSDDSRLAYSQRTRDYLRRRTWRNLRRLALNEADEAPWLALAMGVLLAADDTPPGARSSDWLAVMHLLHGCDPAWQACRGGLSWRRVGAAEDGTPRTQRTEVWPQRWDRHPQALLRLLRQACCARVHAFAARALQDNVPFCAALDDAVLAELLASRWPDAAGFALHQVRARIAAGASAAPWLTALLASPLAQARAEALALIAQDPARYASDPLLLQQLLCAVHDDARQTGRLLLPAAGTAPLPALCAALLDWLAARSGDHDDEAGTLAAIAANLQWALSGPLREAAAGVPLPPLLALFDHACPLVVKTAAHWLLLHPASVQALPPATMARLLRADDAVLRSAGVLLFGALPDATLVQQPELFASFCLSPLTEVRAAIAPVIDRLAPLHPDFGAALMPLLRDELFRAEPAEGVTDHLLACLTGALAEHTLRGDAATTLRLLQARAKGAQRLGAWLLPRQPVESFSVLQTADLGRVDAASARQWAMAQLAAQPQRTLAALDDALRIFDSRWDDARRWAREWFAAQGGDPAWAPAQLVRLCDHPDPGAQQLGRELLARHFDVADVTTYLLQLSQHPSPGMQLFVSNWLAAAAGGRAEVMQRLEPYFISVLSQANRARVAKARIAQFLREQAAQSAELAAIGARVFARQAVSGAMGERARYIAGLREIQARYPELENPVQVLPVRAVAPERMQPRA